MPYHLVILGGWLALIAYWTGKRPSAKKMLRSTPVWRRAAGTGAIIVAAIIASKFHVSAIPVLPIPLDIRGPVGDAFCVAGVVFAIWARDALGKNWSPRPAIVENHELVTSGPYRFVRHPIYTGVFAAMLGTFLVINQLFWFALFIIACVWIYRRTVKEERFMTELFGEKYAEYKERSERLIPFVW